MPALMTKGVHNFPLAYILRVSFKCYWDKMVLYIGGTSLRIFDVNFIAIINPQFLSTLIISTKFDESDSLTIFVPKLIDIISSDIALNKEDLILVGSTSTSCFRFNLLPSMGKLAIDLSLPSSLTPLSRYYAISIRPVTTLFQISIFECPLLLFRYSLEHPPATR